METAGNSLLRFVTDIHNVLQNSVNKSFYEEDTVTTFRLLASQEVRDLIVRMFFDREDKLVPELNEIAHPNMDDPEFRMQVLNFLSDERTKLPKHLQICAEFCKWYYKDIMEDNATTANDAVSHSSILPGIRCKY